MTWRKMDSFNPHDINGQRPPIKWAGYNTEVGTGGVIKHYLTIRDAEGWVYKYVKKDGGDYEQI